MNSTKNLFAALPFCKEISNNGNIHNVFYQDSGHFSSLLPEHALILQHFGVTENTGSFLIPASTATDFFNINFVVEGSLHLEGSGDRILQKGDVFFSSNRENSFLSDDKSKKMKIYYFSLYQTLTSVLFREQAIFNDNRVFRPSAPEKLHGILEKVIALLEENSPEQLSAVSSLLYGFMLELNCQLSSSRKIFSWDILFSRMRRPPFIASASALAETMELPMRVFSKKFKEHFGGSPKKYLSESRLAYASYLLIQENYAISEIASLCNFRDPSHFIHAFKRRTGYSPDQYRKMKKEIPSAFRHTILLNMAGGSNQDLESGSNPDLDSCSSQLSPRRQEILYLLKHNNKLSQRKLAKTLKINVSAVESHLAFLKKEGYLVRMGPARGGYWVVKES